jgi:Domain of unknown function (DUF4170)
MFYVIGGEYEDTRFARLVGESERYGPFRTHAEAEREWRGRTMARIDQALVRYVIVEEAALAA